MELSRVQVREIDRRATAEHGIPGLRLMEKAGRGCAELMMRLNPDRKPVVIVCGPGNNGGDGFVMARHLDRAGWKVQALAVECPGTSVSAGWDYSGLPPDALTNYNLLRQTRIVLCPFPRTPHDDMAQIVMLDSLQRPNQWIVDALFGTGLTRPLESPYQGFVEAMNACGNPILAIDLPSGLDCDTGEPLGVCVKAKDTATFVAPKLGFRNTNAKAYTGQVHVIDIGIPQKLLAEYS